MKLYGAPMPAPNPRRVRMFLAEKGIALAETLVDMRRREHKSPKFGESNREHVVGAMRFFDRELEGRDWLTGDGFSMADICLLSTIDFARWIGLETPAELANLQAWHGRVSRRPSARA